jgi:hypothetical protein
MRLKIQNKVYVQDPVKSNGHERLVILGSLTTNNYRVIYYQITYYTITYSPITKSYIH